MPHFSQFGATFVWYEKNIWIESSDFLRRPQKFEKSSSWFGHLLNERPNHEEDSANICGFLRKAELYEFENHG